MFMGNEETKPASLSNAEKQRIRELNKEAISLIEKLDQIIGELNEFKPSERFNSLGYFEVLLLNLSQKAGMNKPEIVKSENASG